MEDLQVEDVAYHLLTFLSVQDLLNLSLVNKSWYQLSSSDHVWRRRIKYLENGKTASAPYIIPTGITKEQETYIKNKNFLNFNRNKLFYFLNKNNLIFNCLSWNKRNKRKCVAQRIIHYEEKSYGEPVIFNDHLKNDKNIGYVMFKNLSKNYLNIAYIFCDRKDQLIKCTQSYDEIYAISNDLFIGTFHLETFNKVHVYKFKYEIHQFQKIHEFIMEDEHESLIEGVLADEHYLTIMDLTYIWRWDLKSGINMFKVKLSEMIDLTDKIYRSNVKCPNSSVEKTSFKRYNNLKFNLYPIDDTNVLLVNEYYSKKYNHVDRHTVILLNLNDEKQVWEIQFTCLKELKVTKKYIITLHTQSIFILFSFYDIKLGTKLGTVDLNMKSESYERMFCLNNDFLVINTVEYGCHSIYVWNIENRTLEYKHVTKCKLNNLGVSSYIKLLPGPGLTLILFPMRIQRRYSSMYDKCPDLFMNLNKFCHLVHPKHPKPRKYVERKVYIHNPTIINWKNKSQQKLPVKMPILKPHCFPFDAMCFDDTFRFICLYNWDMNCLSVKKYYMW